MRPGRFIALAPALALLLALGRDRARADAGVLLPRDKQAPDPAVLSLEDMRVDIVVEDGDARITIVQIFRNHTANIEEGTYRFALPTGATVADFGVWEGPVRIPAVILERKRAEQVYAEARLQAIDPGLLEGGGERDGSDPRSSAVFTAKIVPIPAYGTKRLELEYHQRLSATDFEQMLTLGLKPDAGAKQVAHHLALHLEVISALPVEDFMVGSRLYPLQPAKANGSGPTVFSGSFKGADVALDDDFTASWRLGAAGADKLAVIAHRSNIAAPLPNASEKGPQAKGSVPEPGYFGAQLLLADPKPAGKVTLQAPRTVVLLFDNSLSMQWDKLERSFAALEGVLRSLAPTDRFNLLLFNQAVSGFGPAPVAATRETVERALAFVRASKLRGGTDLARALDAGLAQAAQAEARTLVLFTDGGSNRGESVLPAKIASSYLARWKATPHPPHTVVFAVGDDANLPLLRALTHAGGFLESVLSTEPIDLHLKALLSKLNRTPVAGLALATDPNRTHFVYPLDDAVYPGSVAAWVGEYTPSAGTLAVVAHGARESGAFEAKAETALPAFEPAHPQLPRLWAQARVDALLAQIDRDGETRAAIDEIIRLSRRFKFVTPYTSFLAVPRSLLRPRVIRPGDPLLRVRTDPAIVSVVAEFPFGLTKPLKHLASEDLHAPGDEADRLWETRFLAPPGMRDGTYSVRLLLRDTGGNLYREAKSFVIASTPPAVKVRLTSARLHRGETTEIRAEASGSTRTLTARLEGAVPVSLRWNARVAASTGVIAIPADLPFGRYTLTVTAEDVAHNLGSAEVPVDVVP